MASLRYKQLPQNFWSTKFLDGIRARLSDLASDASKSKIFYAGRRVYAAQNPSNPVLNHVFTALHPDVENEMRAATEILAKDECEFHIKIQSDRCAVYREGDDLYHVVSIKRAKPPLNPVVLRSQGYEILDTHFLTFQALVAEVTKGKLASREEARKRVREILDIVDKDVRERTSVEPALVLDGKVIWNRMILLTDSVVDELVDAISSHGMVGPNFVNLPDESLADPIYFDFHGHPGYPERWLIPPSIGDIWSSFHSANDGESKASLVIQAVSLRLTTEDFQLFLRPYFREEHWIGATLDPFVVRIAYLNEVYNTSKERPIGEESYRVLDYLTHVVTTLGQNPEIAELMKQFKGLLNEGANQDKLLPVWNSIIQKIENLLNSNIFTRGNWKETLWDMSGGTLS